MPALRHGPQDSQLVTLHDGARLPHPAGSSFDTQYSEVWRGVAVPRFASAMKLSGMRYGRSLGRLDYRGRNTCFDPEAQRNKAWHGAAAR